MGFYFGIFLSPRSRTRPSDSLAATRTRGARDGRDRSSRRSESSPKREVVVSQTVRELVAGPGIEFVDRATHELKGIPGIWQLFALAPPET